jgi:hypothetical protein
MEQEQEQVEQDTGLYLQIAMIYRTLNGIIQGGHLVLDMPKGFGQTKITKGQIYQELLP